MGQFYWVCDNTTLKAKKLWKLFLARQPAANRQLDALKNYVENFNLIVYKRRTSSFSRKIAKAGQFFKGSYKVENVLEEHICKSSTRKGPQMTWQTSWCVSPQYLSAGTSIFSAFSQVSEYGVVESQKLQGAGSNSLQFALLHPTPKDAVVKQASRKVFQ